MIAQVSLGITILVGLHEWGHMFAAKKFGMKVEKFSIGFPPTIISKKIGETIYSFGAIPLGGFVKILGMIDESMDKEQMKQPPQPWEFRSKPIWQRIIVMLGGIIVNVILGVVIFIGLTTYYGENYIPAEKVKHGIYAGELAQEIGLQTEDKITAVNGNVLVDFEDIYSPDAFLNDNAYYTVERDNQTIEVKIPSDFIGKLSSLENGLRSFITPLTTFKVAEVSKGSNSDKGGLLAGDEIIKIGRYDVKYFETFSDTKMKFKGKVVPVKVLRNNEEKTLNIEVDTSGIMGFMRDEPDLYSKRDFSIVEAIPIGTKKAFSIISDNIKGFGKIFSGDVAPGKAVQGPIGIAKMFGGTWNWHRFWSLVGMLSMVLAFMNLLPIPALDGGHVALLSYEMVTGEKPSDKFMEVTQVIGMIILMTLMVFVFSNDIINLF